MAISGLDSRDGGRVGGGGGRKRVSLPKTPPPPSSPHTIPCEARDILFAGYVLVMAINVFMTLWTIKQMFDF